MGSFVFANGLCSTETDALQRSGPLRRRSMVSALAPLLILGEVLQLLSPSYLVLQQRLL